MVGANSLRLMKQVKKTSEAVFSEMFLEQTLLKSSHPLYTGKLLYKGIMARSKDQK